MARRLHFTKMHGLGNDFVVIDGVRQIFTPQKALIKKWADRHRGVGFDQLLLVEKADYPQHDFKYRIFNRDGSEVEQCGNGARCFAKFVYLSGLSTKKSLQVETMKGILQLTLLVDGQVKVVFPPPILDLNKIPFIPKPGLAAPPGHCQWVLLRGEKIPVLCVNVGNPHAVVWVEDIAKAPLATLGKEIAQSEQFPEGVNVGFAQKKDPQHLFLRVRERGVGETEACGSAACAAALAGVLEKGMVSPITVHLPGGSLNIEVAPQEAIVMTGPAEWIYEGYLNDE